MKSTAFVLLLAGCGLRPHPHSTQLVDAARAGDAAAIRSLVAAGADPDQPAGSNGWTPLLHAIHKNQIVSVQALLDAGAGVNRAAGTANPMTPLMMAAGYGYPDIVRLLLRRGADPRLTDSGGFHAIDLAVAGIPDIDRFTVFRCQNETAQVLRAAAPDVRINSRVVIWGRTKRCL